MVTAWPKSAKLRDWESNSQGVEAPWTLALAQKYTRRYFKLQKITRDGAEHCEGDKVAQGMGDIRKRRKHFCTSRGLSSRLRPKGGGSDMR